MTAQNCDRCAYIYELPARCDESMARLIKFDKNLCKAIKRSAKFAESICKECLFFLGMDKA